MSGPGIRYFTLSQQYLVECPEHDFEGFPTQNFYAAKATLEVHERVYHGPLRPRERSGAWAHTGWGVRAMAIVLGFIILAGAAVGVLVIVL